MIARSTYMALRTTSGIQSGTISSTDPIRICHKHRQRARPHTRLTVLELEVLDREVDDRRVFLNVEIVLGEASQVEDQVPASGRRERSDRNISQWYAPAFGTSGGESAAAVYLYDRFAKPKPSKTAEVVVAKQNHSVGRKRPAGWACLSIFATRDFNRFGAR